MPPGRSISSRKQRPLSCLRKPRNIRSPLKVFGEHDEGTLAQMRNCMGVGNVIAGTICADGHLGYAQPFGGVIAYEGQVSISGVGFDVGCGNMAIRLDTPYAAIQDRVARSSATLRA
jgi:tRNA-splicing ligase RtcB (3'-phosphate/5'-hydroxy nucleic acid ligase)